MKYPFKYPYLYAELAMQGRQKKELADALNISVGGLRYKQSKETDGDFKGEEMRIASMLLGKPIAYLFAIENEDLKCN